MGERNTPGGLWDRLDQAREKGPTLEEQERLRACSPSDSSETVLNSWALFTNDERAALEKLGDAFNAFHALPKLHPADLPEFVHHIHILQNMVIARPGARCMYGIAQPVKADSHG